MNSKDSHGVGKAKLALYLFPKHLSIFSTRISLFVTRRFTD